MHKDSFYSKLIGYVLDTNQFTSKVITDIEMAKFYYDKLISVYGIDILEYMFLTKDKRFSAYGSKISVSLKSMLGIKIMQ